MNNEVLSLGGLKLDTLHLMMSVGLGFFLIQTFKEVR